MEPVARYDEPWPREFTHYALPCSAHVQKQCKGRPASTNGAGPLRTPRCRTLGRPLAEVPKSPHHPHAFDGREIAILLPRGPSNRAMEGPAPVARAPRRARAAFLPKCGTAGILFNLRILVRAVLCLFGRRRRRRCAAAASGRCAGASLAAATAGIAAAVGQVAPDSASHCRTWASTALQRSWLVWGGGAGALRQRRGGDGGSRNLRGPRSAAHRPPPSIVYSPQRVARGRYILRPGACCVGGRVTHGLGMGM